MEQIFSKRLKSARQLSGLSLRELAGKIIPELSYQAVSNYEKGKRKPDSSVIVSLAEALDVPVDYFFRESKIKLDNIEFRKKAQLGKKNTDRIKYYSIDYLERYFEIEDILNLKKQFKNPLEKIIVKSREDIETAAIELRKKWELGIDPVHNIIEMLEGKCIKIIEIDFEKDFDGLSAAVHNTPVIVLNKNFDALRKRFTALHELAHLLLRFDSKIDQKQIEKACHQFAGAFLLPEKSLKNAFRPNRKNFSLRELIEIKEYYGISVQAIVFRLHNLGIIPDSALRKFFIMVNKMKQKKETGWGEYIGEESSSRFERLVLMAVSEEIISLSNAAQLLNRDIEEFRKGLMLIS